MEPERRPARVLLREVDELCMQIAASSEFVEALQSVKPFLPASSYTDKLIEGAVPDTPEYPSRKVASHPIAERMRQSTERSNIVRGLADFVMFSFLCDVRYRIAFVENRKTVADPEAWPKFMALYQS